jgi:hypothetical protein
MQMMCKCVSACARARARECVIIMAHVGSMHHPIPDLTTHCWWDKVRVLARNETDTSDASFP